MKEKFKTGLLWFFNSYIWLGILLLIADFVSKQVVVANKETILASDGIVLIPGFLRINYLINNNFVFGLSSGSDLGNRIIFCIVALVIALGIIVYLFKKWDKTDRFYRACFMMIIAGAFGNVIDRVFYSPEFLGYPVNGVVDWIDFYGVWKFNFNIADSSVVVAAFMLIIYMLVTDIIDYRRKKATEPKEKKENNEKVLSVTEQEKNKYIENKDE